MSHETRPPTLEATRPGRPATTSSGRPRVAALDVLRGFALCGILLANIKPIAHMGDTTPVTQSVAAAQDGAWLGLLVDQRFFPIFSLLFGVPAALGLVLTAGAGPALWLQIETPIGDATFSSWFALAGLLIAGVYVCVLLLLLRTPLRPALQRVFAPLGRMALTNYLSATVLVLVAAHVIGGSPDGWSSATVLLLAGAVLVPQWLVSTLWLRHYRQGPLEWLWRWATWAHRPPLRRAP